MLDASCHPHLLLYALPLAHLLLQTLLRQLCEAAALGPLVGDLASHYTVDENKQRFELLAGGDQTHTLASVMGRAYGEGSHHLVPFGQLLLDDISGVGVGGMILGECPQVALASRGNYFPRGTRARCGEGAAGLLE